MEINDLVCFNCVHYNNGNCDAFPAEKFKGGIPYEIIMNNRHDKKFKGQVGDYTYTPKVTSKKIHEK